jgi:hypothetical protein
MASSSSRNHIYGELLYGKLLQFLCDFEMKFLRTKIRYHNGIIVRRSRNYASMGTSCNKFMVLKEIFAHQLLLLFKLVSMHHQLMLTKVITVFDNRHFWKSHKPKPWNLIIHCHQQLQHACRLMHLSMHHYCLMGPFKANVEGCIKLQTYCLKSKVIKMEVAIVV